MGKREAKTEKKNPSRLILSHGVHVACRLRPRATVRCSPMCRKTFALMHVLVVGRAAIDRCVGLWLRARVPVCSFVRENALPICVGGGFPQRSRAPELTLQWKKRKTIIYSLAFAQISFHLPSGIGRRYRCSFQIASSCLTAGLLIIKKTLPSSVLGRGKLDVVIYDPNVVPHSIKTRNVFRANILTRRPSSHPVVCLYTQRPSQATINLPLYRTGSSWQCQTDGFAASGVSIKG